MADLRIEGSLVTGEVALVIAPGTRAPDQERLVERALSDALNEAANQLGAVLAAPAHRFARPLPGKDDAGAVRFAVRGRAEGGRLVPDHGSDKKKRRT